MKKEDWFKGLEDFPFMFLVEVFWNMKLSPLANFYSGYCRDGDYVVVIIGEYRVRIIKLRKGNSSETSIYKWEVFRGIGSIGEQRERGSAFKNGEIELASQIKDEELIKNLIIAASTRIYVKGQKIDGDWPLSQEEAEYILEQAGLFSLVYYEDEADQVWERGEEGIFISHTEGKNVKEEITKTAEEWEKEITKTGGKKLNENKKEEINMFWSCVDPGHSRSPKESEAKIEGYRENLKYFTERLRLAGWQIGCSEEGNFHPQGFRNMRVLTLRACREKV